MPYPSMFYDDLPNDLTMEKQPMGKSYGKGHARHNWQQKACAFNKRLAKRRAKNKASRKARKEHRK